MKRKLTSFERARSVLAVNWSFGPPNSDQLSMQVAGTRLPWIAEQAVDPVAIRVLTSPDGKWVATSNIGAGTISLFDAETRALAKVIPVSEGDAARQVTLLWRPDSRRIYAAETGIDKVAEIDVASGKVLRRIAAGKNGDGLAIAP